MGAADIERACKSELSPPFLAGIGGDIRHLREERRAVDLRVIDERLDVVLGRDPLRVAEQLCEEASSSQAGINRRFRWRAQVEDARPGDCGLRGI